MERKTVSCAIQTNGVRKARISVEKWRSNGQLGETRTHLMQKTHKVLFLYNI